MPFRFNQRWVETPQGYIWAPHLQPVENHENIPPDRLPTHGEDEGMWVEVTIPWVDVTLENPPGRSPWLEYAINPRFYYGQVLWVDGIDFDQNGLAWYRINERYGTYGDTFYGRAEAFRPLTVEDVAPINPDSDDKRVVVNLTDQTLSCFEGQREVYFCRVSTGAKFNAQGEATDTWATPPGPHPVFRKLVSLHMSGGASGVGWDLPGIGWTTFFASGGIAIHSTFWHNNFGVPMSHGCVNAEAADAKWIFRWVNPPVEYEPGDITVSMPGGTTVDVVEI
jgi:lipoprotein-anchoring transpeptidase ErfK/SrfK